VNILADCSRDATPPRVPALSLLAGSTIMAVLGVAWIVNVGALSMSALGTDAYTAGVAAAFVSATLGGAAAAFLARAPGVVWAPVPSITLTYAALCADLVIRAGTDLTAADIWAMLSLTVILSGVMQMIGGALRLGDAIKFLPHPVNVGFMTGVGLLIVWTQAGPLLGLDSQLSSYDWRELPDAVKPGTALIGAVAAATVWILPRFTQRPNPWIAGLVVGSTVYHIAALFYGPDLIGATLGPISPIEMARANLATAWDRFSLPSLPQSALQVLPYAAFIALQSVMNAALMTAAVSDVTGVRPNMNRAITAQGVANVLCGALASLPVTASVPLSMTAARHAAYRAIPLGTPLILFLFIGLFGQALSIVPIAVLAGLLVAVGFSLVDQWIRVLIGRVLHREDARGAIKWNLSIVAAVAVAFFVGSVPLALLVGAVLATILLASSLRAATSFDTQNRHDITSRRVWPPAQAQWLSEQRACIRVFRPRGGLFFATADLLATRLDSLQPHIRYCVLDVSRLTTLDATGCRIIAIKTAKLSASGVTTLIAGLDSTDPEGRAFVALGLTHPDPAQHWFADLDHALEWIEAQVLRVRWPDVSADAPVSLAESTLARGLTEEELRELRSHLRPLDGAPGNLFFQRGDMGAALYVISAGLIEIRIGEGKSYKRLAAFGPGSVFGEIALVTSGERSADAVCVQPTRLYELTRAAADRLAAEHPVLYGKVMANLAVHLSSRLVALTDVVEAQ
jgi:sulfate permease, SulP family